MGKRETLAGAQPSRAAHRASAQHPADRNSMSPFIAG
jgi:hypothetical protein